MSTAHNDCNNVSSPVTEAKARELLKSDLASYESCVKGVIKADLTANQYDALVSFAYSMGCTKFTVFVFLLIRFFFSFLLKKKTFSIIKYYRHIISIKQNSAVVVAVNAEDYDGAKRQLQKYVQANGMILRGLVTRRNYEAALFGQGYNDLNRD